MRINQDHWNKVNHNVDYESHLHDGKNITRKYLNNGPQVAIGNLYIFAEINVFVYYLLVISSILMFKKSYSG
jgi:hypothetical protein